MAKQSAGLLIYRRRGDELEIFLVHPGGPFWKNKDDGAWSIPKGEFASDEDPLLAAQRELHEETGVSIAGPFANMSPVKQRGGKTVYAWLVEADFDAAAIKSNTFTIEWPPRSGKMQAFPEVDRAGWFSFESAARKINVAQRDWLEEMRMIVQ